VVVMPAAAGGLETRRALVSRRLAPRAGELSGRTARWFSQRTGEAAPFAGCVFDVNHWSAETVTAFRGAAR